MTAADDAAPIAESFGPRRAGAAAGLAGFACMAAELTAVRLLAPHFGDSSYVWTNVIGVILGALAVGAFVGGRLAARRDASRWPFRLLAVAGLLLALTAFAAARLGGWLLPADLPLDAAMPAIVRGSFVATAVLFLPPMLLLGAVTPLLVAGLVRQRIDVGRAAGGVGAAGTIGSLCGTFVATHWLVPEFGCRLTMVTAGAVLTLAAVLVARRGGGAARGAVLLVLVAASGGLHGGPLRAAPPGRELLAERESRYQFLQVQRETGPDGSARTLLVINEGLDSFHSVYVAGSAFSGGAYYDWHAIAPLLAGDGARPEGLRALSIGDAAGSLRAVYAGCHPGAVVDGVDIDAACGELGDRWFGTDKANGRSFVVDGRVFLDRTRGTWHVIHVDAYANQVYVPAHLASREFFASARERLEPGGVVACNVGALSANDPVLRAIGGTLTEVFGNAVALQVPNSRNFLLVARRDRPPDPASLQRFTFGAERLGASDAAQWRTIVENARRPELWNDLREVGTVLVDDRPALDRLLLGSYVDHHDDGVVVPCAGGVDVVGAEMDAFRHAQARRWPRVLEAVASSRTPSASLRELAGDARWSLRQLASAVAEYEAGLQLDPDPARATRLREKVVAATAELAPIQRAHAIGTRNGWLEAACAVIAVVGLAALRVWR